LQKQGLEGVKLYLGFAYFFNRNKGNFLLPDWIGNNRQKIGSETGISAKKMGREMGFGQNIGPRPF